MFISMLRKIYDYVDLILSKKKYKKTFKLVKCHSCKHFSPLIIDPSNLRGVLGQCAQRTRTAMIIPTVSANSSCLFWFYQGSLLPFTAPIIHTHSIKEHTTLNMYVRTLRITETQTHNEWMLKLYFNKQERNKR